MSANKQPEDIHALTCVHGGNVRIVLRAFPRDDAFDRERFVSCRTISPGNGGIDSVHLHPDDVRRLMVALGEWLMEGE